MTPRALLFLAASVALLIAPFIAATGFAVVDEAIYFAGAHAFATQGSLFVENGYGQFGSDDLQLQFLVPAQGGTTLTPQYPFGTAVFGAPFYLAFGLRGLMVMNALAMIGTLFALHALARKLFGEIRIADRAVLLFLFGSFSLEYAVGIGPHMPSVLSVTVSFLMLLHALDRETRAWVPAMLSGLALGAGLTFRVDGVLLLPAIAVATVLWAARPVQIFAGGLAGMTPFLAAMAWANTIKFGTPNPLSYGYSDGGGVDLKSYTGVIVAMAVGLGLLTLLRGRRIALPWALAGVAALAVLALAVPQLGRAALAWLRGVHVLIVDFSQVGDHPLIVRDNGTVTFYGVAKQALGQSMPWIGALTALAVLPLGPHRRAVVLVLVTALLWMTPFLMQSWYGGIGSNMRYFLPVVPMLCALGAWVVTVLIDRVERPFRILFYAGIASLIGALAWIALAPSALAGMLQIWSTWVLVAVALAAPVASLARSAPLRATGIAVISFGLGTSAFNGFSDLVVAETRRADWARTEAAAAQVTDPALFVGSALASAIERDAQFSALTYAEPDLDLLRAAQSGGYRLIAPAGLANRLVEDHAGMSLVERSDLPGLLAEIRTSQ